MLDMAIRAAWVFSVWGLSSCLLAALAVYLERRAR